MGFYKLREWVWTETGKGDRLGGRPLGRSEPAFQVASTTALPPPTSISRQGVGHVIGWLFAARPVPVRSFAGCYCKACASHFTCWLFCCKACAGHFICWLLLQGLCRSDRLLAVCYEACAGHFICRLFATTALPCHALPCLACLPLPWPHACCPRPFCPVLFCIPPLCSLPCAPGSSRKLQGLL